MPKNPILVIRLFAMKYKIDILYVKVNSGEYFNAAVENPRNKYNCYIFGKSGRILSILQPRYHLNIQVLYILLSRIQAIEWYQQSRTTSKCLL